MIGRAARFILNLIFWAFFWGVFLAIAIMLVGLALGATHPRSAIRPSSGAVVEPGSQIGLLLQPEAAGAGQPATAKPSLAIIPLERRHAPVIVDPRYSVAAVRPPAGSGLVPVAQPLSRKEAMPAKTEPAAVVASHAAAAAATIRFGLASTYGSGFSEWWVALPEGPGWRLRVCPLGHAGVCRNLVSTDAGPAKHLQRQGRVVDLPVGAFQAVCGGDWRILGLCRVTVQVLGRTR